MQALIEACAAPDYPAEVVVVISNKANAGGLEIARNCGIPVHICNHKDFASREDFDSALCDIINGYKVDLVCLAGFMRIFSPVYFDRISVPTLNIHPALLPKHKGLHTHEAVLGAGDQEHGCTVHLVTPELDAGPIILQNIIPVSSDDTIDTLTMRVLAEEHKAYPEAVRKILQSQ